MQLHVHDTTISVINARLLCSIAYTYWSGKFFSENILNEEHFQWKYIWTECQEFRKRKIKILKV